MMTWDDFKRYVDEQLAGHPEAKGAQLVQIDTFMPDDEAHAPYVRVLPLRGDPLGVVRYEIVISDDGL